MLKARFYLVYTYFSLVFKFIQELMEAKRKASVRSKVGVHV